METIEINVDDVNYAIKKLSAYDDCYANGIVSVFSSYLMHKDFVRMRDELETVPSINRAFDRIWDINARIGFLEVIYPSVRKEACNG